MPQYLQRLRAATTYTMVFDRDTPVLIDALERLVRRNGYLDAEYKNIQEQAYRQRAQVVYNFHNQRNQRSRMMKELQAMAHDPPSRLLRLGGVGYQNAQNRLSRLAG
jgi:hypothetical protein